MIQCALYYSQDSSTKFSNFAWMVDSEQSDKHPSAWFNTDPYLYVKIPSGVVFVVACLSFRNALRKENMSLLSKSQTKSLRK